MSQNKTIIPESEYDLSHPTYTDLNSSSDFYRPSGAVANSTVISGMNPSSVPPPIPSNFTSREPSSPHISQERRIPLQERVIVGVLFSISKGLLGEIFPIYLGRNMVGSSPTCDICLKERTVSDEHAVLYARCDGYPGDCYLSITDYGSSHGTTVNQKDSSYETITLRDGDVVTVGRHYRLSVRLFGVAKSGLFEDSGFEDMDSSVSTGPTAYQATNDFYSPSQYGSENTNRTVIG